MLVSFVVSRNVVEPVHSICIVPVSCWTLYIFVRRAEHDGHNSASRLRYDVHPGLSELEDSVLHEKPYCVDEPL